MDQGWVKIHRNMLNWEWFTDVNTCHLFIYLLLKANRKERKWRGEAIQRGQLITSNDSLKQATGLSVSQIRTSLKKLESCNSLARKTTNKFTLITIANYDSYQITKQDNDTLNSTQNDNQIANESQTDSNQIATNKNIKNINNIYIGENEPEVPPDTIPQFEDNTPEDRVATAWAKTKPGSICRPRDRLTVSQYVAGKGEEWCLQAVSKRTNETYIGQCFYNFEKSQETNGRTNKSKPNRDFSSQTSSYGEEIAI